MSARVVCFGLLFSCALASPNGAPLEACKDMVPNHPYPPSNLDDSPYQVSATVLNERNIAGTTGVIIVAECCDKANIGGCC